MHLLPFKMAQYNFEGNTSLHQDMRAETKNSEKTVDKNVKRHIWIKALNMLRTMTLSMQPN